MKFKKVFLYPFITLASFHGQGIVVARKRSRSEWSGSGTTESPFFLRSKKCPKVAYGNYLRGIMLGCIYDMKHKPPQHSTDNPSHSYLVQTKKHRLEIIDEDGKEEIRFETAEGKMRAILGPKGIELVNELDGGIEIKCKRLNIKGKNINLTAKNDFISEAKKQIDKENPVLLSMIYKGGGML